MQYKPFSRQLETIERIKSDVVPVILEANKKERLNLNKTWGDKGKPVCLFGHCLQISDEDGWVIDFTNWHRELSSHQWTAIFGPAQFGSLDDRVKELDSMIASEKSKREKASVPH
jgi:hypothetical protein